MATRVLVDANVLFSRTVRDWVFLLKLESQCGMFSLLCTVDILSEALARLRDTYPDLPGAVIADIHDRVLANIDERVDDFEVGTFAGSDSDDAHVDAAARASAADAILTSDEGWSQMSEHALDELPYEVFTPDEFLCLIDDSNSAVVAAVVKHQLRYWMDRDGDVDLPARLRAANCRDFADRVRDHLQSVEL